MKEFTFVAYCTFGKGDSGETYVDVELTDEEVERLIKYGTDPDVYWNGFSNCEELEDIYKKVYAVALDQITEELREWGDWVDEDDANNPDWKADDLYACGVNFPSEFEEMMSEEDDDEEVF